MEQPVICVIVPVYKAEATLPRCIESVLTQQLPQGTRGFRRAQCRATGRHRRVYCIFGQ